MEKPTYEALLEVPRRERPAPYSLAIFDMNWAAACGAYRHPRPFVAVLTVVAVGMTAIVAFQPAPMSFKILVAALMILWSAGNYALSVGQVQRFVERQSSAGVDSERGE